jgi:hypothetical protein
VVRAVLLASCLLGSLFLFLSLAALTLPVFTSSLPEAHVEASSADGDEKAFSAPQPVEERTSDLDGADADEVPAAVLSGRRARLFAPRRNAISARLLFSPMTRNASSMWRCAAIEPFSTR